MPSSSQKGFLSSDAYKNQESSSVVSTVNVNELKKQKSGEKIYEEDSLWYNQLRYWIAFGSILSVFSLVIAIFYRQFVYLIPLGPILGVISWYVRKIIRKYDEKTRGLFK